MSLFFQEIVHWFVCIYFVIENIDRKSGGRSHINDYDIIDRPKNINLAKSTNETL